MIQASFIDRRWRHPALVPVFFFALALLLLLESWLLAAAAIALGTALAIGGVAVVASWLAQARSLPLSPLVWPAGASWVLALAWAAASLAALWPAWRAARMDLHRTLAQG